MRFLALFIAFENLPNFNSGHRRVSNLMKLHNAANVDIRQKARQPAFTSLGPLLSPLSLNPLTCIDGGSARILYGDRNYEVYPASWSPDGQQIAVRRYILEKAAKGGPIKTEIGLVDFAGGSIRVLKSLGKPCATQICFSDDGRYLVYDFPSDKDSGRYDLSLLAIDGSREVPLVRHPANDRLLGWVPGTRALIFRSDRSDTYDLYMLHVSDDGPQGAPEPTSGRSERSHLSALSMTDPSIFPSTQDRHPCVLPPSIWKAEGCNLRLKKRIEDPTCSPSGCPMGTIWPQ